MKGYKLKLFLIFIFSLAAMIGIMFSIDSIKQYDFYIDTEKEYLKNYNHEFENMSIAFIPYAKSDISNVYQKLENIYGEKLIGSNSAYNQINNLSIRMVSDFLFDEKYITLLEGRMPDLTKTSSDFTEVLADNYFEYNLNQIFSLKITNYETNENFNIDCKIVGKYNKYAFPYPEYFDNNIGANMIIPDYNYTNFELLENRNKVLFFTFAELQAKTEAAALLNNYGSIRIYDKEKNSSEKIEILMSEKKINLAFCIVVIIALILFFILINGNLFDSLQFNLLPTVNILGLIFAPIIAAILFYCIFGVIGVLYLYSKNSILISNITIVFIMELILIYYIFFNKKIITYFKKKFTKKELSNDSN